jgi:hypothetical protein
MTNPVADVVDFAEKFLGLKPTDFQKRVLRQMDECLRAGGNLRPVMLRGRQQGWSTIDHIWLEYIKQRILE